MNSKAVYFGLLGLLGLPACGQDTLDNTGNPGPMGMGPANPTTTNAAVNPAPNPDMDMPAPATGQAPTGPSEGVMPQLPLTPPAADPGAAPPPAGETPPAMMPAAPPAMLPPATPGEIVGAFDGFLFSAPCGDGGTGYDCLNSINTCSDGQNTQFQRAFPIAGDAGTTYDVTVRVRGVVELKNYNNDVRAAGNMSNSDSEPNFWASGGTIPQSTYNTYELNISPEVPGAANHYWVNSRDGSNEDHESWPVDLQATFPVQAGGTINFRMFDLNCRQIMNCGSGTGSSTCRAPRTVDLSNSVPPLANFAQPFQGPAGAFGQWLHFDVVSVVARE